MFHLKHGVVADLPAVATVITDPDERQRVLAEFVDDFNHRIGPDSPWPGGSPGGVGGAEPVGEGHI